MIAHERVQARLEELREQQRLGQTQMQQLQQEQERLQQQQAQLSATMLRISGAIQVLDQLIAAEEARVAEDGPQQAAE